MSRGKGYGNGKVNKTSSKANLASNLTSNKANNQSKMPNNKTRASKTLISKTSLICKPTHNSSKIKPSKKTVSNLSNKPNLSRNKPLKIMNNKVSSK